MTEKITHDNYEQRVKDEAIMLCEEVIYSILEELEEGETSFDTWTRLTGERFIDEWFSMNKFTFTESSVIADISNTKLYEGLVDTNLSAEDQIKQKAFYIWKQDVVNAFQDQLSETLEQEHLAPLQDTEEVYSKHVETVEDKLEELKVALSDLEIEQNEHEENSVEYNNKQDEIENLEKEIEKMETVMENTQEDFDQIQYKISNIEVFIGGIK